MEQADFLKQHSAVSAVSHPLAATASAKTYALGGNAADAAVAAAFALTVVEPQSSGVAGQAHILVYDSASGKFEAIDAYAMAPEASKSDMYRWKSSDTQGDYRFHTVNEANTVGYQAVAIPGALLGWYHLHKQYGRLPFSTVIEPAVHLAREGFEMDQRLADKVLRNVDKLVQFPSTQKIWFREEKHPLEAGDLVTQSDFARTLELIARDGPEVFYRGVIAEAIARELRGKGIMTTRDLEYAYDNLLQTGSPIVDSFRGWQINGHALCTAGGTLVIFVLRLLEELSSELDDEFIVLFIETLRVAYRARLDTFGHGPISLEDIEILLSDSNIAQAAIKVRDAIEKYEAHSSNSLPRKSYSPGENTTHHSHLDSDGNCVVCTQSLGDQFGSGVTVPGFGLLLNNAMKLFDPRPGSHNSIAPFRKMLSSMAPIILTGSDDSMIGLGSPSGTRIISAVSQVLINHLWREYSLPKAVSSPRVHLSGENVEYEANLSMTERSALSKRGYPMRELTSLNDWFGSVQIVNRKPDGDLSGVSDPRRNGAAIFYNAWNSH